MWLKKNSYRDSRIEAFPGCYNTGQSPAVYHGYLDMLYKADEFYAVGRSGDLLTPEGRAKAHVAYWEGRRKVKGSSGTIFIYRTMATARQKYEESCKTALTERAARIEERATIAARAKAGDLAAALELGLDW